MPQNKSHKKFWIAAAIFACTALILITASPFAANAQGVFGSETTSFGQYISNVYTFAIGAMALAAVVMIIIGGYRYITAAGNEQRIGDAKDIIFSALTGLLIVLLSYLLLNTINPELLSFPETPELNIEDITLPPSAYCAQEGELSTSKRDGCCKPDLVEDSQTKICKKVSCRSDRVGCESRQPECIKNGGECLPYSTKSGICWYCDDYNKCLPEGYRGCIPGHDVLKCCFEGTYLYCNESEGNRCDPIAPTDQP